MKAEKQTELFDAVNLKKKFLNNHGNLPKMKTAVIV
jgi:hypothetical protein